MSSVRKTSRVTGGPASVGAVVDNYLKYIRAEKAVHQYRDLPKWNEVVGEDLAQVTHPERIVRNVLHVRVLDGVWVQELTMKKREILQRLFDAQVGPPLDDIIFVAGDPTEFER